MLIQALTIYAIICITITMLFIVVGWWRDRD